MVFFLVVVDAWMTVKVGGYCHAVEAQRKSLAAVDGFYRHPTQRKSGNFQG